MSYRSASGSPYELYDAVDNRLTAEKELAQIMAICGLDPTAIDSITIDEIINAIESTFAYDKREFVEHTPDTEPIYVSFPKTASRDLISKRQFLLKDIARRMWRERHLAIYQQGL